MENSCRPTTSVQLESHSSTAEDNTLTPELSDKVFKNELIRDRIFDYIFTSDNAQIRTYGLVEKYWLDCIIRRIRRTSASTSNDLSFKYWGQSKEDQESKRKEYQVHKFLKTWATFPGAGSRVPFFNLDFNGPFDGAMKNGSIQDLSKCLLRCGNGLHRLQLNLDCISDDEVSDTVNRLDSVPDLGSLDLPNLTDLYVQLPDKGTQVVVALLLPPVLSGCKRLRSLILQVAIPSELSMNRFILAPGLDEKVDSLPDTIKKIKFDVPMTSQLLSNLFLKNSLPNLTEIDLNIEISAYRTGVVCRILDLFSRQLKVFNVETRYGKSEIALKFPVMTKLEEMSVSGFHLEAEHGTEQPFPVLNILMLQLEPSTIQKWMKTFQFNCVHELHIGSCKNNNEWTLELSQQLHTSFPYVQNLQICGGGRMEDRFMQNIFQHMTQLRRLSIHIVGTSDIVGASTWDAILLGVSPEYARNLAESPRELWDSVNLNHFRTPSRSIVNLSNLTMLSMCSSVDADMDELDPLISDVSFHFAFLRMPSLVMLGLYPGFGASKKMKEEWKRRGRKLTTNLFGGWEDTDSSVSEEEQDV